MTDFAVWLDVDGKPTRMGDVQSDERDGRTLRCEFNYDTAYLAQPDRLALDAATPVTDRRWVTAKLPRGLADAGPDGWGRSLLLRSAGGRVMNPSELLLAVDDTSRMGALRLRIGSGWESATEIRVPTLIHLAELQEAADSVESDDEAMGAIGRLVGAGSASLGGMRPKASVLSDTGSLALAKFQSRRDFPFDRDGISVIAWEKVCLDLAEKAGIPVPNNRLMRIAGSPVLVLDRFDRTPQGRRVPYLSAFAITDAVDAASGDYLDIGDALTEFDTVDLPDALRQLWRRAAFNVAMRNTDDHLKNHAILWRGGGWRLSPAFDITPNHVGGTPRATQIAGEEHTSGEARGLAKLAGEFGIAKDEQHTILSDILKAVATWQEYAANVGIASNEIQRLQRAIEDAHRRLAAL